MWLESGPLDDGELGAKRQRRATEFSRPVADGCSRLFLKFLRTICGLTKINSDIACWFKPWLDGRSAAAPPHPTCQASRRSSPTSAPRLERRRQRR